jgi:hypothetical protein
LEDCPLVLPVAELSEEVWPVAPVLDCPLLEVEPALDWPLLSVAPVFDWPLLEVDELVAELPCPFWSVLLLEGEVVDWPDEPACVPLLPPVLPELPVCALKLSASKSTGAAIHAFFMLYSSRWNCCLWEIDGLEKMDKARQ